VPDGIRASRKRISHDGEVTNEGTAEFLRNIWAEFALFIGRVYTVLPRGVTQPVDPEPGCGHAVPAGGEVRAHS
jgi:hypothetical protein